VSRLESFRRRITAQIDGLNWALEQTSTLEGDVLELGLGNGRTYDHIRENTERRVWVVDRLLQCHPSCVPPEEDFLQGEATEALTRLRTGGHKIVLAHYDLGHGDKAHDVQESLDMSRQIRAVMAPGGLVMSQQPMEGMQQVAGPASIPKDRYYFFKV